MADEIHMLVDQLGNEPGQVLGRQPVIQRRRQQSLIRVEHAERLVRRATSASRNARLRSVQELLRTIHRHRAHQPPIMPRTLPSPDHPARRVADPGSWMMNDKNVQRLWRDEGLRVPATRWCKRLGSSIAPRIPTADCAKQGAAVDFQFDATTDGRSIKIGWNRTGDLPLFRRSCGLHRCVSTGETGSGMSNRAGWSTQPAGLAPFWPHGLATGLRSGL